MYAKKSLGQHFLRCQWVVSTLIKAADLTHTDTVLEIGPGTGVLTRALAERAGRAVAVEKDEKLAEGLRSQLAKENITNINIIAGDILDHPVPSLVRYKVVANIPYYLTARLLRSLLEREMKPELIVLTIQKEVAQRIIAKPPKMSLLALSVQAFGKPKIVKTVPASCFWPKPKVDSAIIKISDISDEFFQKNGVDKEFFFEIARRAFSQKRKMITHTLRDQHPMLIKILEQEGIPPKARPEELSPDQWANLVAGLSTGNYQTPSA